VTSETSSQDYLLFIKGIWNRTIGYWILDVFKRFYTVLFVQTFKIYGNPLTGLTLPHVCACPKPNLDFQRNMSWSFCVREGLLFVLLIMMELFTITFEIFFSLSFALVKQV
jgi:hypothetical protein